MACDSKDVSINYQCFAKPHGWFLDDDPWFYPCPCIKVNKFRKRHGWNWTTLTVEFLGTYLTTRLNRSTTVHKTGNEPRSTKKFKTPKSIKVRSNYGGGLLQSICLTLQFSPFNWKECLVALDCWLNKPKFFLSGEEFELFWSISHRQSFSVIKYNSNRIITANRIIMRDNITGLDTHIKYYPITFSINTLKQILASIHLEKINATTFSWQSKNLSPILELDRTSRPQLNK